MCTCFTLEKLSSPVRVVWAVSTTDILRSSANYGNKLLLFSVVSLPFFKSSIFFHCTTSTTNSVTVWELNRKILFCVCSLLTTNELYKELLFKAKREYGSYSATHFKMKNANISHLAILVCSLTFFTYGATTKAFTRTCSSYTRVFRNPPSSHLITTFFATLHKYSQFQRTIVTKIIWLLTRREGGGWARIEKWWKIERKGNIFPFLFLHLRS